MDRSEYPHREVTFSIPNTRSGDKYDESVYMSLPTQMGRSTGICIQSDDSQTSTQTPTHLSSAKRCTQPLIQTMDNASPQERRSNLNSEATCSINTYTHSRDNSVDPQTSDMQHSGQRSRLSSFANSVLYPIFGGLASRFMHTHEINSANPEHKETTHTTQTSDIEGVPLTESSIPFKGVPQSEHSLNVKVVPQTSDIKGVPLTESSIPFQGVPQSEHSLNIKVVPQTKIVQTPEIKDMPSSILFQGVPQSILNQGIKVVPQKEIAHSSEIKEIPHALQASNIKGVPCDTNSYWQHRQPSSDSQTHVSSLAQGVQPIIVKHMYSEAVPLQMQDTCLPSPQQYQTQFNTANIPNFKTTGDILSPVHASTPLTEQELSVPERYAGNNMQPQESVIPARHSNVPSGSQEYVIPGRHENVHSFSLQNTVTSTSQNPMPHVSSSNRHTFFTWLAKMLTV